MSSFVSFARGHGGGAGASTSVGAAFIIGALLVAVLGLRWVGAAGGSKEGADETPWEFTDAANVDTSTTIPPSTPAKVVPIPDPDLAGASDTTTTTRPGQTVGVFLPGYSPTPGGGVGPSTTIRPTDTTRPRPTTTRPGVTTTRPPPTTTDPPPTTTEPPPTTTDPPPTTTEPPPTTTEPPTTVPEPAAISDAIEERISQQLAALGWPYS